MSNKKPNKRVKQNLNVAVLDADEVFRRIEGAAEWQARDQLTRIVLRDVGTTKLHSLLWLLQGGPPLAEIQEDMSRLQAKKTQYVKRYTNGFIETLSQGSRKIFGYLEFLAKMKQMSVNSIYSKIRGVREVHGELVRELDRCIRNTKRVKATCDLLIAGITLVTGVGALGAASLRLMSAGSVSCGLLTSLASAAGTVQAFNTGSGLALGVTRSVGVKVVESLYESKNASVAPTRFGLRPPPNKLLPRENMQQIEPISWEPSFIRRESCNQQQ